MQTIYTSKLNVVNTYKLHTFWVSIRILKFIRLLHAGRSIFISIQIGDSGHISVVVASVCVQVSVSIIVNMVMVMPRQLMSVEGAAI